ncbi:hypothetical protein LINPERHAP2_LOCUS32495, partial [Linum perenne]
ILSFLQHKGGLSLLSTFPLYKKLGSQEARLPNQGYQAKAIRPRQSEAKQST